MGVRILLSAGQARPGDGWPGCGRCAIGIIEARELTMADLHKWQAVRVYGVPARIRCTLGLDTGERIEYPGLIRCDVIDLDRRDRPCSRCDQLRSDKVSKAA